MIGTGGALDTATLSLAAGAVGVTSFLVALIASRWLPEPEGSQLPE